jgi:hypothetical protein
MPRPAVFCLLPALAAAALAVAAPASGVPDPPIASVTEWTVTDARLALTPMASRLETLGLEVVAVRGETVRDAEGTAIPSFRTGVAPDLRVRTDAGRVVGFSGADVAFEGGLILRVRDADGTARPPLTLVDFALGIDASATPVRFLAMDPDAPSPMEVRNAAFGLDRAGGQVLLRGGDLFLTAEWARSIGRPDLGGEWLGAADVTFRLAESTTADEPEPDSRSMTTLDVQLGELYGMLSAAHAGTYPNGSAGLSAATTSCNNGDVNVPWNEPMAETHPFIGLAMFRIEDGVLEQIGRNWIKHGWFAFANDQCDLGCVGGGGTYLAVGCSDTYSAYNNASLYTLGPRAEVNPHTGDWSACGSFFDATPVDCLRNYVPTLNEEQFNVDHRVHVADADLDHEGAVYRYEGVYYVKNDADIANNIGWRECTMSWTGSNWSFADVNPIQNAPEPGPVVATWGDQTSNVVVAPDDGEAWLSVAVTDLGGSQWHYEYAFYNRTSARGFREFTVPVGDASVSNVEFGDLDDSSANDWPWQIADGLLTWSTDEEANNPTAPALEYQMLFNFRFDADAPPLGASARGALFRSGTGEIFFLDTQAPSSGSTSAPGIASTGPGLELRALEPNPFADGTRIRFSQAQAGATRLSVVDVAGRTLRTLLDGTSPAGSHTVRWDGRDDQGRAVASGVYFVHLEDGTRVRTAKLTRIR